MGLFNTMKEPVVLKADSLAKAQLTQLSKLLETAPADIRPQIEQDIRLLTYGVYGEDTILFELKNSHLPMYILHDLYFEEEDLSAQIDFLVVTRKITFVIECKNLFGNIEINSRGEFIRSYEYGGKYRKEGIYSPVTQNQRHLEMIRKIRLKSKDGIIKKALFDKYFKDNYRSVIVLANPKTILNDRYAKKEIKDQVIRADQLIRYIKEANQASEMGSNSDKHMENIANYFLGMHKEKPVEVAEKYQAAELSEAQPLVKQTCADSDVLISKLKAFRLETSRAEGVKPYFIFSDKQLEDLISKSPRTLEDLMCVCGFGTVKCQKYGEAILEIITNT